MGRFSHTVCRITQKGKDALRIYEQGLRSLFAERVPAQEDQQKIG